MLLAGLESDEAKFTPTTWSPHANTTHSVTLHWHSYLPWLNHFCLLESVGPGPVIAQCWHSARIADAKQLAYLVVAGERRGWIFYSGEEGAGSHPPHCAIDAVQLGAANGRAVIQRLATALQQARGTQVDQV